MNKALTNLLKAVAVMVELLERRVINDFEVDQCGLENCRCTIEFSFIHNDTDMRRIVVDEYGYRIDHDYETVVTVNDVADMVKVILLLNEINKLGS